MVPKRTLRHTYIYIHYLFLCCGQFAGASTSNRPKEPAAPPSTAPPPPWRAPKPPVGLPPSHLLRGTAEDPDPDSWPPYDCSTTTTFAIITCRATNRANRALLWRATFQEVHTQHHPTTKKLRGSVGKIRTLCKGGIPKPFARVESQTLERPLLFQKTTKR